MKKTKVLNVFRTILKINILEKGLRKLTQNKLSTSFVCKFAPNNYQYQADTIRVFDYKGIILEVDISDYVGHYLYFGFKDIAQEKLINLAKEGNCVLDIGTNIGSTILQFAKKIKDNGCVYGFEPDLYNIERCNKNINLNKFENVFVENIGLGDKPGKFKLYIDTISNRGGNRIKIDDDKNKEFSIVNVLKLDDWIKSKEINKIDLIKIDVEGFETNVIKGGLETINLYKPIMFIEVDNNNLLDTNSSASELVGMLEGLSYSIINAETGRIVTSKDNFENCHYDIIAKYK